MRRKFSKEQQAYLFARAVYDNAHKEYFAHDKMMDEEGERLGLSPSYAILPEDHPMWIEAQHLLDLEVAASRDLRTATNALFDWALDTVFAKIGTEEQKKHIRENFETVKRMSHVQKIHKDAVNLCMSFAPSKK